METTTAAHTTGPSFDADFGPEDPIWTAPDSDARRRTLGHRAEPYVPGYCTCGELIAE